MLIRYTTQSYDHQRLQTKEWKKVNNSGEQNRRSDKFYLEEKLAGSTIIRRGVEGVQEVYDEIERQIWGMVRKFGKKENKVCIDDKLSANTRELIEKRGKLRAKEILTL